MMHRKLPPSDSNHSHNSSSSYWFFTRCRSTSPRFARPKIGRQIQSYWLGRASVVVAGDLENAFTIAARQRKPVRLALSGGWSA